MNVRTLKDSAGAVFSPKVSTDSVYMSGSTTNLTSKLNTLDTKTSGKLDKLTYEFSKELAMGSSGYVCIGKFPCYDSNVTINIDSTTSTTYHGTLVIATQNINTSGGGTLTANVYDDVNNTLTPALKLEYNSGSRNVNVYFQPAPWSKNLVHVRCVALRSEPTDILTSISSIPSTANRTITNVLKSALDASGGDYLPVGGGTITGDLAINQYLKLNARPGYGTGSADFWYSGNGTYLEIQNATNLKLAGVNVWKAGDAVTGAVWNDLIDCIDIPEDDIIESGYCYCMNEDGHYRKSEKYLDNRFIGIDSDTYSLAMNMEPEKRKLNAAVSGFVLAYVDKEYPIGTALTCTENGYLTEIKKEDKCYNPERIIATYWKNEEREEIVKEDRTVKVNGRKWVKIK